MQRRHVHWRHRRRRLASAPAGRAIPSRSERTQRQRCPRGQATWRRMSAMRHRPRPAAADSTVRRMRRERSGRRNIEAAGSSCYSVQHKGPHAPAVDMKQHTNPSAACAYASEIELGTHAWRIYGTLLPNRSRRRAVLHAMHSPLRLLPWLYRHGVLTRRFLGHFRLIRLCLRVAEVCPFTPGGAHHTPDCPAESGLERHRDSVRHVSNVGVSLNFDDNQLLNKRGNSR